MDDNFYRVEKGFYTKELISDTKLGRKSHQKDDRKITKSYNNAGYLLNGNRCHQSIEKLKENNKRYAKSLSIHFYKIIKTRKLLLRSIIAFLNSSTNCIKSYKK